MLMTEDDDDRVRTQDEHDILCDSNGSTNFREEGEPEIGKRFCVPGNSLVDPSQGNLVG